MLGPLFRKELVTLARQRRYYVLRVVVGLALLLGLWVAFPSQGARTTTAALSGVGQAVFAGWTSVAALGIFLLVPMLVCGVVAGERDAHTLDILLTTCLKDREILVGKLAGRLLLVALIVAASLPILAVASWFGGFEAADVGRAVLLLATVAAVTAALAAYYSTVTAKPSVALIRTYLVLVLLWYVIPHALPLLLQAYWGRRFQEFFELVSPEVIVRGGPAAESFRGLVVAAYALGSAWLLRRGCRRLRQPVGQAAAPLVLRVLRRLFGGIVAAVTTFVEKRRHWHGFKQFWHFELISRYWGDVERRLGERFNPLLLRSAAANVYDPQGYVAALQALAWLAFLVAMFYVGWFLDPSSLTDRQVYLIVLSAELAVLFLLALVLAASAIVRERQSGALDLLFLSDLSATQFVFGSFWGVLRTLWPTVLLLAISVTLVGYTQSFGLEKLVWLLFVLAFLAYLVLVWLGVSLVSRRIPEAIGFGLVVTVIMLGLPIVLAAANWYLIGAPLRRAGHVEPAGHAFLMLAGTTLLLTPFGQRRPRWQILLAAVLIPTAVSALVVVTGPVLLGALLALVALAVCAKAWSAEAPWTTRDVQWLGSLLIALVAWYAAEQALLRVLVATYRIFPEAAWPYITYLSWLGAISHFNLGWRAVEFFAPLRELFLSSVVAALLLVWQFDRLSGRRLRQPSHRTIGDNRNIERDANPK